MNISELRTRVDALNGRSSLVTRTTEPDETSILTLVDAAERSDAAEMPDPLIQALMDKLRSPTPFGRLMTVVNGLRLRRWHSISSTGLLKLSRSKLRQS